MFLTGLIKWVLNIETVGWVSYKQLKTPFKNTALRRILNWKPDMILCLRTKTHF